MAKSKSYKHPIIELELLSRSYKSSTNVKTQALSNVNLKIYPSEFVVISGESGSGKTTLLRILGLLDTKYEGKYLLNKVLLKNKVEWERDEIRAKNIGFVFQEGKLFDHLNVHDNIILPAKLSSSKHRIETISQQVEKEREDFFSRVEISQDILAKKPNELSGGQRQRASVWRAIFNKPAIILADEPTASLDSQRKQEIVDMLEAFTKQGHTVVVVSHDSVFHGRGRQIKLEGGTISKDEGGEKDHLEGQELHTTFNHLSTWNGWKPRASFLTLLQQVIREVRRPLFFLLVVIALIAGLGQAAVFWSMMAGTGKFIDDTIKQGSRLNRITIKPRRVDRGKDELFPIRSELEKWDEVESFVSRRESILRILNFTGKDIPLTTIGLHNNDPEYELFDFVAGGPFSSNQALEIIVTSSFINDLFSSRESGKQLNDYIGEKVEGLVNSFDALGNVRETANPKLKIVGIISDAEGNRDIYIPHITLLAFNRFTVDRKAEYPLPLKEDCSNWSVDSDALISYASFVPEDRLHVYIKDLQEVRPVFRELHQRGQEVKSEIFAFAWVLDLRSQAQRILLPLLILSVIVVAITVFVNLYTSSRLREKEFALWRILGMRTGDLVLTQVLSAVITSAVGSFLGLLLALTLIEINRWYLNNTQTDQPLEKIFAPLSGYWSWLFLGALVLAIISALLPAYRTAKTDPAKVLESN